MDSIDANGCPDIGALQALVEGFAAPDAREAMRDHLTGCEACRRVVLALAPERPHDTMPTGQVLSGGRVAEAGERIGRYVVLRKLGEGGMGIVYAAYDPELDRQIALKLIRPAQNGVVGADVQERLVREGQAMARVAHPNVATVFDVGRHGDQVFVAMELVGGETLGSWLSRGTRSLADMVDVFVWAGRGLCAVHAAGLVHRDFKPNNVMIDGAGRVRVMDFGLARRGRPRDEGDAAGAPPPSPLLCDHTLTATGTLVGTPSYMAPEQLACAATDARTDQFSFCVALYEAACDARPFVAADSHELVERIRANALEPPARHVPRWLLAALARGLRADPDERWPSMDELLHALTHPPRRFGWPAVVAAVLVCALAAGALTLRARAVRCGGFSRELVGIWDARRRSAVEAAVAAGRGDDPGNDFVALAALLDRYAASWVEARTDACRAGDGGGGDRADLRLICLDDRRDQLGALTELLTRGDPDVTRHAVDAAAKLPPVSGCSDVSALGERDPPPREPAERQRRDELQKRMLGVIVLNDAGKFEDALTQAKSLLVDATALGYRGMIAEANYYIVLDEQRVRGLSDVDRHLSTDRRNAAIVERHDLTGDVLDREMRARAEAGFRPTWLSGYAVRGEARYAALFERYAGPKWIARIGLSRGEYEAELAAQRAAGYRLALVNGYTVGDVDRFVAIWDRAQGVASLERHDMSADEFQAELAARVAAGYRPMHLSGYGGAAGERFAAIFEAKPGARWIARIGLSWADYQAEFDAQFLAGYYATLVSGYPVGNDVHYVGIWEQGALSGWSAHHGMTTSELETMLEALRLQGGRPIVLGGFAHGDSVEYAGVWRNWAISGNNLSSIDLIVNDTMQKIGAPGLSLAIAQSGRLVYAKAFGYSDAASKTPLTTSDRFRIGGISELVTASAIQLLAARGRLRLDDRVFGTGALLGERFGTPPYGRAIGSMTVRQLLAHTAGWPSGAADPTRTSPATTPDALVAWSLDHVALVHAPGPTSSPSRLDYVILARIVERLTSQPYAAWVGAHVLAPAGIHEMQLATEARAPNEVADVDRAHEDLARLDGAAGFLASPVDLVRLAVHLDGTDERETWSQRAGLPGASAIVVRTAGEFTWAAAVNAPDADAALDAMMWRIVSSVTAWPSRDFFATP